MFPPTNKACFVSLASVHPRLKSWDDKLSTIINKYKFLSAYDLQSWVGKMMIEEEINISQILLSVGQGFRRLTQIDAWGCFGL